MIRVLSGFTFEIDDVDLAVAEILEGLDLARCALGHSVGVLTCSVGFIQSGVVRALCGRVPFDVIGKTTIANGADGAVGQRMLTLTVLTSDDVEFCCARTGSLHDMQEQPLRLAYESAVAASSAQPRLMIAFAPLIAHVGGELIVDTVTRVTGGLPLFGSIACDDNVDYHEARTIHNGECLADAMVFALVIGEIYPDFYVASMPKEKIQRQSAVITASEGNVLKSVNDMPILDYLQSQNLIENGGLLGNDPLPAVINYGDGLKPVTRTIYRLDAQRHAVCGGRMPVGAQLSIAAIDRYDVLTTARQVIGLILQSPKRSGLLMFPCASRKLALGEDVLGELDQVTDDIARQVEYLFAYSGGEFCPTYLLNGKTANQFHNYSFTACAF